MRTIRVWVRDFLHNDLLVVYLIFHLIFFPQYTLEYPTVKKYFGHLYKYIVYAYWVFYMFTLCLYTQFRKQIIIYTLLLRYMPSSGHVVVIHVVYYYSDIWRHLTMLSLFTLSKYTFTPSLYVTLPRILPSVSHNHSLTVKDSHNANLFLFLMKCFPTLITISRSKFLWNVFEELITNGWNVLDNALIDYKYKCYRM